MTISRDKARSIAFAAILGVLLLQAFNSFVCYKHGLVAFLTVVAIFLVAPLLPALFYLTQKNPLPAVGACILFAPWLLLAYHTDCVLPYSGGGASMIYVAVLIWGTPSAVIGALLTIPLMRWFDIEVE